MPWELFSQLVLEAVPKAVWVYNPRQTKHMGSPAHCPSAAVHFKWVPSQKKKKKKV